MNEYTDLLPYLRLYLNIKYPALEDCWLEGYQHAQAEKSETANPYSKESKEFHYWTEGWWAGFYNEPSDFYQESTEKNTIAMHPFSTVAANQAVFENGEWTEWGTRVAKATAIVAASMVVYAFYDMAS